MSSCSRGGRDRSLGSWRARRWRGGVEGSGMGDVMGKLPGSDMSKWESCCEMIEDDGENKQ